MQTGVNVKIVLKFKRVKQVLKTVLQFYSEKNQLEILPDIKEVLFWFCQKFFH